MGVENDDLRKLSRLGRSVLGAFTNNCKLCGNRWANFKMQEQCDDTEACMKRKNDKSSKMRMPTTHTNTEGQ